MTLRKTHLVRTVDVLQESHEGGDVHLRVETLKRSVAPPLKLILGLLFLAEDGAHLFLLGLQPLRLPLALARLLLLLPLLLLLLLLLKLGRAGAGHYSLDAPAATTRTRGFIPKAATSVPVARVLLTCDAILARLVSIISRHTVDSGIFR